MHVQGATGLRTKAGSHGVAGVPWASPALAPLLPAAHKTSTPRLPAFKQSPTAIPTLGANVKKRRHGDEDMYYMHVSVPCLRSLGGGSQ